MYVGTCVHAYIHIFVHTSATYVLNIQIFEVDAKTAHVNQSIAHIFSTFNEVSCHATYYMLSICVH